MAYQYDPINKMLIKTNDEQIKFINEGQKFRNKANIEIKLTEVIPNRVQYSIYRNGKLSENSKTSDPETMIKILNRNGYVPVKDSKTIDSPVIRNKIESTIKKLENIKKMYNTEENKIDDNIRLKPEEKRKAYEDLEKQYKDMIINVLDTLKNNL